MYTYIYPDVHLITFMFVLRVSNLLQRSADGD
jgi:hypothetical protein